MEVFTWLLSVGFNYNRTRRTQTPKSVSTQQLNSPESQTRLCYSVVLRVGYFMCVDTVIKSNETLRKDNCFSFCFFQSYNFKTPMVYHWIYSATSLKFSSQSIHHRLGCRRIKNSSQVNLQLLISGPLRVITLRIPLCNFTSCGDYNLLLSFSSYLLRLA